MDNGLVKQFLKILYKAIDDRLSDTPQIVSGVIDSVNNNGSVNLHIPPDNTIFSNIPNETSFLLNPGDCVKILKDKGKASNMWIMAKCGINNSLDLIFPVGSIICYTNPELNPNNILGGTWRVIKTDNNINLSQEENINIQNLYYWNRIK